jgi:hypothetical protein
MRAGQKTGLSARTRKESPKGSRRPSKMVENFLDGVKVASGEALVLLNGKTKKGMLDYPTSGFHVGEGSDLDESISDRIEGLYKHINNCIYVINQHGVLMNHLMSSDSNEKLIDPKKLLEGIKSLEKGFTTDNED